MNKIKQALKSRFSSKKKNIDEMTIGELGLGITNDGIVSEYLKKIKKYPYVSDTIKRDLSFEFNNGYLLIKGNPNDLIDLADNLVSLALSGENRGQHIHLDSYTGSLSADSSITDVVLGRND